MAMLSESEDWLYSEEGEDASKSAYVSRLETLQKVGAPIHFRWKENDERPRAASQLREVVNKYMSVFENEPEKYDHLSDEDKTKVIEKAATVGKWLDDYMYKQSEMPKNVDPKLTTEQILKNKDEVIYVCTPILTKPKPRVANEAPNTEGEGQAPQSEENQQQKQQGDMDVD